MLANERRPASAATLWVAGPHLDHLKVNGRPPRTLQDLAAARAEYAFISRMKEIEQMAPKLALLIPFLEPLAARGVALAKREITRWGRDKALRIQPMLFSPDDQLHAALLAVGFREVSRREFIREDLVTLKHGRSLLVMINVSRPLPGDS